jgi:hypothetical protein
MFALSIEFSWVIGSKHQQKKNREIQGMSGKVFLYHAHGFALGGMITQPFKENIESHAATSLPSIGGFASVKAENYSLKEIVSYDGAHTYVSGIQNDDGVHSSVATSTLEGLNILDVITADAIIGRLSARHKDGAPAEIITLGSSFVNLKIAGQPVEVDLDNDLFTLNPTYSGLLDHLQGKGKAAKKAPSGKSRYQWGAAGTDVPKGMEKGMLIPSATGWNHANGILHTSLVKQIRPVGSNSSPEEPPYAYAIQIPHVGTVYLGELFVSADTKRLSMLRVELGSPVVASMQAVSAVTNGSWPQ